MEITSTNNNLVKETVKLQQKKYRNEKFLLEGYKAVKEAFDSGIEIDYAFVLKEKLQNYEFLKDKIISTNEIVLKKISTTDSSPEIVAVGYQKKYNLSDIEKSQKVVLLENIKDLGNLGTIIRSCVAFDVDAIILYGESTDLYNPKCVRSAVGNLWKIPIVEVKDFSKLQQMFSKYQRIATLPRATNLLNDFRPKKPYVVMFGSEADGLSETLVNFATDSVKIEMLKTVESLNLSISCAVMMYEFMKY